jgi:orotate phosphoribosyltransferase
MLLDDKDKETITKELYTFIDKNCLFRTNPETSYYEEFAPGRLYPSYPSKNPITHQFYLRRLTHNGKMLFFLTALFFDDLARKINSGEESSRIQLAGLETSSIPIMIGMQQYAAANKIFMNTFSIRKQRKNYGLFNLIDGIPNEDPVIIVDDIFNSGSTVSRCLDVCEYELNLKPANNIYSIIKFNSQTQKVKYKDNEMNLFSIFSLEDFDTRYDPDTYWMPVDCDKSYNKRPEYK